MKITIEITNDNYIVLLSRWASLERTINSAIGGCDDFADGNEKGDKDRAQTASEELEEIKQAIVYLHRAAQQQMWEQACNTFIKEMLGNRYLCRLEKGHKGACRGW